MNGDANPETPPQTPKNPSTDLPEVSSTSNDAVYTQQSLPPAATPPPEGNFFRPENGSPSGIAVDASNVTDQPVLGSIAGYEADFNQPQDRFAEAAPARTELTWVSSPSINAQKSKSWYGALLAGSAVLTGVVYLISRDIVSSVAIMVIAIVFGAISTRRPHALRYALDDHGIQIGQKHFVFSQFRSFSIVDEGGYSSIALAPLKRFLPFMSLSYDPQLRDQIVAILSEHLPLEEYKVDAFEQITNRIKF